MEEVRRIIWMYARRARLWLAGIYVSFLVGCISEAGTGSLNREQNQIPPTPAYKGVPPDPTFTTANASCRFFKEKKEWPKDFDELLRFLKVSDIPTYNLLRSGRYNSINFQIRPDGWLEIHMDYVTSYDVSGPSISARIRNMNVKTSLSMSPESAK
jgi:hypothetical protein